MGTTKVFFSLDTYVVSPCCRVSCWLDLGLGIRLRVTEVVEQVSNHLLFCSKDLSYFEEKQLLTRHTMRDHCAVLYCHLGIFPQGYDVLYVRPPEFTLSA